MRLQVPNQGVIHTSGVARERRGSGFQTNCKNRGSQLGEADSRALCCHAIILCRTIDQLRDLQLWVLPREIGGHRCGGERGTAAPPASARPDPYARKEEEERE